MFRAFAASLWRVFSFLHTHPPPLPWLAATGDPLPNFFYFFAVCLSGCFLLFLVFPSIRRLFFWILFCLLFSKIVFLGILFASDGFKSPFGVVLCPVSRKRLKSKISPFGGFCVRSLFCCLVPCRMCVRVCVCRCAVPLPWIFRGVGLTLWNFRIIQTALAGCILSLEEVLTLPARRRL